MFLRNDNPAGTAESELLARDKLAHELMYLSRGNPVVYFGDEQGFTGAGNDQAARQDMWASLDPEYDNVGDDAGQNDNIGSDETPADDNFDEDHPLYQEIKGLADLTKAHPALRDGAHAAPLLERRRPGIYAFSRLDRDEQREYVVALNNAESAKTATIPTWMASTRFDRLYGGGARRRSQRRRPRARGHGAGAVGGRLPGVEEAARQRRGAVGGDRQPAHNGEAGRGWRSPPTSAATPSTRSRSTRRDGDGKWKPIGTDDNAPYRVFHDIWDTEPGTQLQYKAVVLDNAGHTRESAPRSARVAKPAITLDAPNEGQRRARHGDRAGDDRPGALATTTCASSGRSTAARSTTVGTDDSSPVYTAFDDTSRLRRRGDVTYRAVLTYAPGKTVTSATRTATVVQTPVDRGGHPLQRPDGDYDAWGLHLFGDALAPGEATAAWENPTPFEGTDAFGVLHEIGDRGRHQAGRLHRPPPAAGRTRTSRTRTGRPTASSTRSPRRRSGSARATRGSTAARRRTPAAWCHRPNPPNLVVNKLFGNG